MTKQALIELRDKVAAGEVLQANDASNIWPTTYNKETRHNDLPWQDACNASQGSLDAAVAFLEAVLPEAGWVVSSLNESRGPIIASVWTNTVFEARADTPARALLLATLDALIAISND